MKTMALVTFLLIPQLLFDQQATLFEEPQVQEVSSGLTGRTSSEKVAPLTDVFTGGDYSSALHLRAQRRVGLGFVAAGQLGLAGALIELNYGVKDSAVVGFGGGSRYNSFSMQWKHVFNGHTVLPYTSLGLSRWYSNSANNENFNSSIPQFFANDFLSDDEKSSGKFGKDFFTPSFGFQYYQIKGQYAGVSLFAEILMLISTSDFKQVATGSLGMTYFF